MSTKVKVILLAMILTAAAYGTYEFTGPLVDLSSSWTTGRLSYTTTNADGYVQLDTCDDLTAFIAGTANQITVTDDSDGSATLSTPQDIDTGASPTFYDLTLSNPSHIYALDHDSFAGFVANEHIDWTTDQGSTNIDRGNIPNVSDADFGDVNVVSGDWTVEDFTLTADANGGDFDITDINAICVDKVDADGAALALGDNDETVAIDSSDWDIDATGNASGLGTIDADGAITTSAGVTATGTIRANTAFSLNGSTGVSGTLVLDDGTTERITLVFTGGILTSRTVAASSGLVLDWTD